MARSSKNFWWAVLGSVFIILFGSLLHFVFDISPGFLTSVFGAVNESVWEHLKILFWPSLLFCIAKKLFLKGGQNIFTAGAAGAAVGMLSITVGFYTYTGIIGRNFFIIDILLFCLGSALSAWIPYYLAERFFCGNRFAAFLFWILFAAAFAVFTFYPPALGIFISP